VPPSELGPRSGPGPGALSVLHHVSIPVADLARARRVYDAALGALGYRCVCTADGFAGYGIHDGEDKFALMAVPGPIVPNRGLHIAFAAPSRAAVDAFHRGALAAGATDNGPPGLRPHYGPTYYAAFILDADGHRIEAVHKS